MKHRTSSRALLASLLCGAALGACTVGPNYRKPDVPVPAAYQEIGSSKDAPLSRPVVAPLDDTQVAAWWRQFDDPTLNSLVARAMDGNLDLKTEVARIRQSREQEVISGAAGLPHATLVANALQLNDSASNPALSNLFSGGAGQMGAGGAPGGAAGGEQNGTSRFDTLALATDATWEVDLFGRVRRGVEAARAGTQAMVWAKRDGQVSLTAEVATDYFTLRDLQVQIAIAEQEVARQKDTFAIIHQQAETGFVTRLNVNQQQAQVQATIAAIPQLQAQARGQIHALGVLIGQAPESLAAELDRPTGELPNVPQTLPVGLPSELLRRRPDVREAERELAQATANVGVHVAQLYPSFNIIALGAFAAPEVGEIFNANSATSVGVGLVQWPIFQGGQIRGQIRSARAQQDEAYYAYKKAVLTALRDVEDSLARYQADQRRIIAQKASVDASTNSVLIARQQYETGLVTYINVLQSQQTLLNARNELTQDEGQLATDLVALYKALGGGWTADEGKLLKTAGVSSP